MDGRDSIGTKVYTTLSPTINSTLTTMASSNSVLELKEKIDLLTNDIENLKNLKETVINLQDKVNLLEKQLIIEKLKILNKEN